MVGSGLCPSGVLSRLALGMLSRVASRRCSSPIFVELVPPKSWRAAKSGEERPHETGIPEPDETALPEGQRPEPATYAQTLKKPESRERETCANLEPSFSELSGYLPVVVVCLDSIDTGWSLSEIVDSFWIRTNRFR